MIEFAVMSYGLLASFVLSCLHQNNRRRQTSPEIMVALGYVLCGMSATFAMILGGTALYIAIH